MKELLIERLPSILLIVIILLPNLLFFAFPPNSVPEGKHPATINWITLEGLENIGRIGVFAVPLFYTFQVDGLFAWISLAGLFISLTFYYALFIRYFVKGRAFHLLFSPFLFIPIPLAIFPLFAFAFSSILMRSFLLLLATCLLAYGHIPISYYEYKRSKPQAPEANIMK